jgi:hypothetical protein
MPYASNRQRRFLHAVKPEVAAVYDRHERQAPAIGSAVDFSTLRQRGLVGISDRVIADHLAMYERWCAELRLLDAAIASRPLTAPAAMPSAAVEDLLRRRVRDLPLQEISGRLEEVIDQLKGEFVARGITWFPTFYLGEADFWTADRATSINVPWYLGDDVLWSFVNGQDARYTPEEVLGILRHEAGHALGYAFELYRRQDWKRTFGNFGASYRDEFPIDAQSTDYVRHLHVMDAGANAHYAQKHPDEDWAETFAVWLDPGSRWREAYAAWPGALAKLEAVELMLVGEGAAYGLPSDTRIGRRVPYATLDYTVGEYLGQAEQDRPDPRAAALRRRPEVYSAVVLHELYFGGLERGANGLGLALTGRFAELAGPDWAADFRVAAEASGVGWVLAVWDRRDNRVRNVLVRGHDQGVPPGCEVLLALDMHEHSYAADVGARRDAYVAAWFRNVSWSVVNGRLDRAYPPRVGAFTIENPNAMFVGDLAERSDAVFVRRDVVIKPPGDI